jgi:hypothetical protein
MLGTLTKSERIALFGNVNGGSSSRNPELYQIQCIKEGTGLSVAKTSMRINWYSNEMVETHHPMKHKDGYNYTENFDGVQELSSKRVFLNLKCVVGKGGSQTRTLRDECYRFIHAQLVFLQKYPNTCYFANVFDGDEAHRNMEKFNHILSLPEFKEVASNIYVGDTQGYIEWITAVIDGEQ